MTDTKGERVDSLYAQIRAINKPFKCFKYFAFFPKNAFIIHDGFITAHI